MFYRILLAVVPLFFSFVLVGCGGGSSETSGTSTSPTPLQSYSLETIDDESFNALSEEDRVYVANKLYATLYKGKSLGEIKKEIATGSFITDFRKRLAAKQVSQPDLDKIVKDSYTIPDGKRFGDPLLKKFNGIFVEVATTLYYTRLGKSYYDEWMAYVLNQTILFSPAWEVESVHPFPELIRSNYERIRSEIAADHPVATVVYNHMISKENWARFRSPEDNGREMLEIWLYDFNDLHVPLAARALRNWKWVVKYEPVSATANDYVYYFYNDTNNADEINTEPIEEFEAFFGRPVTTGRDFYKAVVQHKDFLPGVVLRLVNLFFPDFSEDRKRQIVGEIVKGEPATFRDIFDAILFSKVYLFESTRVKSYEEIYFSLAHTFDITPGADIFGFFHQTGRQVYEGGLVVSKQRAFTYKLGRSDRVPSDSDSVMRLHLNIRDAIFLNRRGTKGWNYANLLSRYDTSSLENYLESMFLEVVGRHMTEAEKKKLTEIAVNAGCVSATGFDKFTIMLMTFDYFSRLSEIYIYRKVDSQGGAS